MRFAKLRLADKKLYKFRSIRKDPANPGMPDQDKLRYIERIFSHNELHFPSPTELNDPLECRPFYITGDLSDSEYKQRYISYFKKIMSKNGKDINLSDIENFLNNIVQPEADGYAKSMREEHRLMAEDIRICSFCSEPDNPIVWSHYSDSHRGFCLVFDASDYPFGDAYEVTYQEEKPSMDVIEEDMNEVFKVTALVKYEGWKYEKEFRLVSREPGSEGLLRVQNQKYIFPEKKLVGVIFGLNISNEDRKLLVSICTDRQRNIIFKQAIISDDRFGLDIIDV